MIREILISANEDEIRAALICDNRLSALEIERAEAPATVGGVYRAKVEKIVPGINGAFLSLGSGQPGLMQSRDGLREIPGRDDPLPQINDLVEEGQSVFVQITRPAMGDKGPRVSRQINLPGRLVVFQPLGSKPHVSKRIGDDNRDRLIDLADALCADLNCGVIVRTAAEQAEDGEIRAEAEHLKSQWEERVAQEGENGKAEALLPPPDLMHRALRDWTDPLPSVIWIENEAAMAHARGLCEAEYPVLAERLRLHDAPPHLFEDPEIAGQIETALEERVDLDGGGWIQIEETEALTVIDVNSGTASEGASARNSALDVNIRAAGEIGRQLRLRNLGGAFVIDFIGLRDPKARDKVEKALIHALAEDPSPSRVFGWTALGLVEMTRRRDGPTLSQVWPG